VDVEAIDPEFAAYVRARRGHLLGAAVLICGDPHLAEDLVQEALVKLARHWPRVKDGMPDAYVRRTMYRDNVSWWRRRRHQRLTAAVEAPEGGPDPTGSWESQADVRAALLRLPTRQRAVVVLRYFEDLTETQAADVLGISVGTVKSHTYRAMAALEVLLRPDPERVRPSVGKDDGL
jgi:RNA polymerase sigma-70 factor (sigma-E family)